MAQRLAALSRCNDDECLKLGSRQAFRLLATACVTIGAVCGTPVVAASNNVRITQLSDVAFGLITNASSDASSSQSLCVYSNTANDGYSVRAFGSGAGGAFTLASGSSSLPYDVEWNSASGQSIGTVLVPNISLSGQVTQARQQTCNSGPSTSASLIVTIRSSALASAEAGSYNGALTLVISPE